MGWNEALDVDATSELEGGEDLLFSRIPLLRNRSKSSYLSYRACGFSVREACAMSSISESLVRQWRQKDPEFAEFESYKLHELQLSVGPDILKLEFLRNMKLALKKDYRILWKSLFDPADMDEREYDYLKLIRKHYTPQDLLALHKALSPEADESESALPNITVIIGDQVVVEESARRAAARDLLAKFVTNRKMLEEGEAKEIEGEVVEPDLVAELEAEHGNGDI